MVGGADDEVKGLRATMQLVTAAWTRVVSSQVWLTWLGLTRYAGVATLATGSISPGESAISIRGFL